jgi:hypothetical protein
MFSLSCCTQCFIERLLSYAMSDLALDRSDVGPTLQVCCMLLHSRIGFVSWR